MTPQRKPVVVLIAEDDEEDRMLVEEAVQEARMVHDVRFVEDGHGLLDYLRHRGDYANPASSPRPDVILLDLNMPNKGGLEALEEIKADPNLRQIPVVVLTMSRAKEDIFHSYDGGVAGFITKPVTFQGLVEAMRTVGEYWFDIVALPTERCKE